MTRVGVVHVYEKDWTKDKRKRDDTVTALSGVQYVSNRD
jgi:hypothetical protein